MGGKLILVVGPSGAGKDTLLGLAMRRLQNEPNIRFPRRLITRPTDGATEDHIAIDAREFDRRLAENDYALAWKAHGLGYIIPAEVQRALKVGTSVVCNVSRSILPDAVKKFPNCAVVLITADPDIRARRLASRGREGFEDISARLTREAAPTPRNIIAITIDNSGHLAESAEHFCAALLNIAHNHIAKSAPR